MTSHSDRDETREGDGELPVREGYAAWSSCYDDDDNPLIALEGPAMREWFGPLQGRRALDIGCGAGRHTHALVEAGAGAGAGRHTQARVEAGADVVALDLTPEMIARARAKPSLREAASRVLWVRHA